MGQLENNLSEMQIPLGMLLGSRGGMECKSGFELILKKWFMKTNFIILRKFKGNAFFLKNI